MNKYFTGHLGRRYREEQIDDSRCGSCDGAMCDHCSPRWEVDGKVFLSFEEAEEYEKSLSKDLLSLLGLVPLGSELSYNYFFIMGSIELRMDVLFYSCYDARDEERAIIIDTHPCIMCNPESSLYDDIFLAVLYKMDKYRECTCIDKDNDDCNACSLYGCNDESCYREMKSGKRKEKKWYM